MGRDPSLICQYESGRKTPYLSSVKTIAAAIPGCSLWRILLLSADEGELLEIQRLLNEII